MPKPKAFYMRKVIGCARCGGKHREIKCNAFTRPVALDNDSRFATHFARCPKTGEPILVEVVSGAPSRTRTPSVLSVRET